MIDLIFPDGSKREFEAGVTGKEVAASIAISLAKRAALIKLDGELLDVDRPLGKEAGTIYTSSYHIYKEEEEAKKKKGAAQKAEVRELGLRPLALNWEPAH